MRAFAYTGNGKADWIETDRPKATGFDAVIRPWVVAPCTSDVHNVAINCLKPNRILGHEGVGQIVEVGELSCKLLENENAKTYDMYAEYSEKISKIPSHRILAVNRGEKEECLKVNIVVDTEDVLMICPRSEEQSIKKYIDDVKFNNGEKHI